MNTIVRSFMPVEQIDWVQRALDDRRVDSASQAVVEPDCFPCIEPELSRFEGIYRDPWFGDVNVSQNNGQLLFSALKSSRLTGTLEACDGRRFIIRWQDRTLQADAYVHFEAGADGTVSGMTLSRLERGGYDFEDLAFVKVASQ